jgi:hypothetical protein
MTNNVSGKNSIDLIKVKMSLYKTAIAYAICYCFVFAIALFKESYFDFSFLGQASFPGNDEPWLPSGLIAEPVLGSHFFGDFYLPFRTVNEANPYSPDNPFNNILPFGQISYQLLGLFRVNDAFYIYTFTAILIFAIGIRKILLFSENIEKAEANLFSVFILLFSFPIVTAIDRGANVLFVAGVICWVSVFLMSKKISRMNHLILVLLLVYTISAKMYLLPLLIFIWLFYSKRTATQALVLFFFLNILFSFQFGGPAIVFRQLELSLRTFSASENPDLLFGSLSQSGLIAQSMRFLGVFPENKFMLIAIGFLPGLILLCVVILVSRILQLKLILVLSLALSCFQYMTPVSYVYTAVWASISIALLTSAKLNGLSEIENLIFPVLYAGVCTQLLPIHIFEHYKFLIPLCWFLTMSIVLWIAISFRYKTDFPRKSEAETGH